MVNNLRMGLLDKILLIVGILIVVGVYVFNPGILFIITLVIFFFVYVLPVVLVVILVLIIVWFIGRNNAKLAKILLMVGIGLLIILSVNYVISSAPRVFGYDSCRDKYDCDKLQEEMLQEEMCGEYSSTTRDCYSEVWDSAEYKDCWESFNSCSNSIPEREYWWYFLALGLPGVISILLGALLIGSRGNFAPKVGLLILIAGLSIFLIASTFNSIDFQIYTNTSLEGFVVSLLLLVAIILLSFVGYRNWLFIYKNINRKKILIGIGIILVILVALFFLSNLGYKKLEKMERTECQNSLVDCYEQLTKSKCEESLPVDTCRQIVFRSEEYSKCRKEWEGCYEKYRDLKKQEKIQNSKSKARIMILISFSILAGLFSIRKYNKKI